MPAASPRRGSARSESAGPRAVLERLRARGLSLAVAESCTGGLLGGRLTAVPGSSDVFAGGVIAYADRVKSALLGVPRALLTRHGAVSREVARVMAEGIRRRLGVSCALAVTGVAGPGGGTRAKPVGLVWIAAAAPRVRARGEAEQVVVRRFDFRGDRDAVRRQSVDAALALLLALLEDGEKVPGTFSEDGAPASTSRPATGRSRPRSGSSGPARRPSAAASRAGRSRT